MNDRDDRVDQVWDIWTNCGTVMIDYRVRSVSGHFPLLKE